MSKEVEMKSPNTPMDTPPVKTVLPTGRERARLRWVTVEPIYVLAMIGNTCTALVRPLYVKDVISESYNYNETSDNHTKCGADQPSNGTSLSDKIQAESAMWLLYLAAASGFPAMLSTIIFGSTSDRLGRKLTMAIPLSAFAIQAAVYLFTVIFKLPLAVLFTGEVLQGLAGGYGLLFSSTNAYLADATSEKQRTIRIVVADMLQYLSGGLNQLGQGYLIKVGYIPSLAIAIGSNVAALVYIAIPLCLIETVERGSIEHQGLRQVWRSMKRLVMYNVNGRRWQMILLTLYVYFCIGQFIGVSAIYVLYGTGKPFCWLSETAGLASSLIWISLAIGMLVGTKLFSLCLGDYWLMQISCLSFMASYLIIGLAKSTAVLYIGLLRNVCGLSSTDVSLGCTVGPLKDIPPRRDRCNVVNHRVHGKHIVHIQSTVDKSVRGHRILPTATDLLCVFRYYRYSRRNDTGFAAFLASEENLR